MCADLGHGVHCNLLLRNKDLSNKGSIINGWKYSELAVLKGMVS
jgi:hypothetical protein